MITSMQAMGKTMRSVRPTWRSTGFIWILRSSLLVSRLMIGGWMMATMAM